MWRGEVHIQYSLGYHLFGSHWIDIKVITEWWHPPTVFVHCFGLVWFGMGSYKKLIAIRGWLFYPLINWLQFSTIHTKLTLTNRFGIHQMRIMDLDKLNSVQIRDCSLVLGSCLFLLLPTTKLPQKMMLAQK